ncbi:MAG: hypothetical protein RO257_08450 [Candidatus Kapabacteria bacterium]|jgi:hypothetical protein|nr:hypothetical protein [Candidatus Kapabacteria bacterium]
MKRSQIFGLKDFSWNFFERHLLPEPKKPKLEYYKCKAMLFQTILQNGDLESLETIVICAVGLEILKPQIQIFFVDIDNICTTNIE